MINDVASRIHSRHYPVVEHSFCHDLPIDYAMDLFITSIDDPPEIYGSRAVHGRLHVHYPDVQVLALLQTGFKIYR